MVQCSFKQTVYSVSDLELFKIKNRVQSLNTFVAFYYVKFLDGLLLLCTVLWSILFLQLQLCYITFCAILSSCSRHNFSGDENPSGNSLSVTIIVEIFKLFISLRHHLWNLCSLFFPSILFIPHSYQFLWESFMLLM